MQPLSLGWLGGFPACRHFDTHGLSYYCLFFDALRRTADVAMINASMTEDTRSRLDAIVLPFECTINTRALPHCIARLHPSYPPAVLMLNKVFEGLERKLRLVQQNRTRFALLVSPSPHSEEYSSKAHVPVVFLPYATTEKVGRFSEAGRLVSLLPFAADPEWYSSMARIAETGERNVARPPREFPLSSGGVVGVGSLCVPPPHTTPCTADEYDARLWLHRRFE